MDAQVYNLRDPRTREGLLQTMFGNSLWANLFCAPLWQTPLANLVGKPNLENRLQQPPWQTSQANLFGKPNWQTTWDILGYSSSF